jgi:hypothetical protein
MSNDKGYKKFWGRRPTRRTRVDFHNPQQLIFLGRAVAIEYECDKTHGGGDGKVAVYRHAFGPYTLLCMDERNKDQLYVLGEKLKVTRAGIEG